MSYFIIRPENHEQWLKARSEGIGSSDAGTIMGASPFSTPLQLWRQKKGIDPPVKESHAMKIGHFLELAVAEYFASETGATIDYNSEGDWIAADEERPYLRVSPDRLYWPAGTEQTSENWHLLEIKSTSKPVEQDDIPLYWYCQVQYQMHILGLKKAVIAYITSYPRLTMGHVEVDYNEGFALTLIDEIERFWIENILGNKEPEAVNGADVPLKWPTETAGKKEKCTDEQLTLCKRYLEAKQQIKQLENETETIAEFLKTQIRDSEALVHYNPDTGKETTIASYIASNISTFDEEAFRRDHPDLWEQNCTRRLDKERLLKNHQDTALTYAGTAKGARRFCIRAAAAAIMQ